MEDIASLGIAVDSTQVKSAGKELDKLTDSGARAEKSTDALTLSNIKLSTILKTVGASWVANQVYQYAKDAALLNARYETLGIVMGVVGQQAGYNQTQLDGYAESLRKSGITMTEARQTVISMAQAEIDLAQATQLGRVAQDAAVIGGINSSEALGRVVYGIKSAQVEVLRTVGLNVNFENSYAKLATQLGRNVATLSEAEKAQARTNAVMEAGTLISGSYEGAMTSAGKQLTSLARLEEDLKVIIGEVFNDTLVIAVEGYTSALKGATAEATALSVAGDLRAWGENLVTTLAILADATSVVGSTFSIAGKQAGAMAAVLANPLSAKSIWAEYEKDFDAYSSGIGKYQKAAEERIAVMSKERAVTKEVSDILKQHAQVAGDIAPKIQRLDTLYFEGNLTLQKYNDALRTLTGTWAKANDKSKESSDEAAKFIAKLREEVAVLGLSAEAKIRHTAASLQMTRGDRAAVELLIQRVETNKYNIEIEKQMTKLAEQRTAATQAEVEGLAQLAQETNSIYASMATGAKERADYQYAATVEGVNKEIASIRQKYGIEMNLSAEYDLFIEAAQKKRELDARSSMDILLDQWRDASQQMSDASAGWLSSFTDGLTDLVLDGKASFKDFANSVIRDILRIIIQQRIAGIVGNVVSGLGTQGTGGDGTYSTPPTDGTGIYGYASGGNPPVGKPYLVGENGPEIRIDRTPSTIIPNDQIGGQNIVVNNVFQISTGVQETVRAEIMAMAPMLEERSKQGVFAAIERGGSASRAVGRRA